METNGLNENEIKRYLLRTCSGQLNHMIRIEPIVLNQDILSF